jgi:hypothetical protein
VRDTAQTIFDTLFANAIRHADGPEDPAGPSDPTDPTDPTDPAGPAGPAGQTEPTGPAPRSAEPPRAPVDERTSRPAQRVDPAELFAVSLVGALDADVLNIWNPAWRTTTEPLFRYDHSDPSEVFRTGMAPRDPANFDLMSRTTADAGTVYVATTSDPELHAHPLSDRIYHGSFRYEIQALGGIVVNDTMLAHSPAFEYEREVVFAGGVKPRFIRGAHEITAGGELGRYFPNPGFDPQVEIGRQADPGAQPSDQQPTAGPQESVVADASWFLASDSEDDEPGVSAFEFERFAAAESDEDSVASDGADEDSVASDGADEDSADPWSQLGWAQTRLDMPRRLGVNPYFGGGVPSAYVAIAAAPVRPDAMADSVSAANFLVESQSQAFMRKYWPQVLPINRENFLRWVNGDNSYVGYSTNCGEVTILVYEAMINGIILPALPDVTGRGGVTTSLEAYFGSNFLVLRGPDVRPQDRKGYDWIIEVLKAGAPGGHGIVYYEASENVVSGQVGSVKKMTGHVVNVHARWDFDLGKTVVDYIDGQSGEPARLLSDPELLYFMPVGSLAMLRPISSGRNLGMDSVASWSELEHLPSEIDRSTWAVMNPYFSGELPSTYVAPTPVRHGPMADSVSAANFLTDSQALEFMEEHWPQVPLVNRDNYLRAAGGDRDFSGYMTNCGIVAWLTYLAMLHGIGLVADPDLAGVGENVGSVANRFRGTFIPVRDVGFASRDLGGYGWITEYMKGAGPGAHGVVFMAQDADDMGHFFNVHARFDFRLDKTIVDYLDGRTGRPALLLEDPELLYFMPVGNQPALERIWGDPNLGAFGGMQPDQGEPSSSGLPARAPDASPTDLANIRYQEEAAEFERRLGWYVSEREDVRDEFGIAEDGRPRPSGAGGTEAE